MQVGDIYTIKEVDKFEKVRREANQQLVKLYHYHGEAVRKLFMLAAVIMTLALPFVHDLLLPSPPYFVILILPILAIAIFAGLTNPVQWFTTALDLFISVAAVIVFEYQAVSAAHYDNFSAGLYFSVNQILAVIFLFASYYAMKTARSRWLS